MIKVKCENQILFENAIEQKSINSFTKMQEIIKNTRNLTKPFDASTIYGFKRI